VVWDFYYYRFCPARLDEVGGARREDVLAPAQWFLVKAGSEGLRTVARFYPLGIFKS
jgi:hypothetical protein